MFFNDDKIIAYPNRKVTEDLLSRNGLPTEESFTPYNGMNFLIAKYCKKEEAPVVDYMAIVNNMSDWEASKKRPSDDADVSSAADVVEYHTRLEDIDESFVSSYIGNIIFAYLRNEKKGMRELKEELADTMTFWDSETGSATAETDVLRRDEVSTTEEILGATKKLPYLLRLLHIGSIAYGGSLLSFIIAMERFRREVHTTDNPTPRQIYENNTWAVDRKGNLTGLFVATDNKNDPFRTLMNWICGVYPNDIYYKAYKDLIGVIYTLDLDITQEDPRQYNKEYIRRMIVTYLDTNEEFIENYGFGDRKILELLTPDKLFKIRSDTAREKALPAKVQDQMLADCIATNTESFTHKHGWSANPKEVNEFLRRFYAHWLPSEKPKTVGDYKVKKGLLCKPQDDNYVVMNVGGMFDNAIERKQVVVSSCGYLILLNSGSEDSVMCLAIRDANEYLKMGSAFYAVEWTPFSI